MSYRAGVGPGLAIALGIEEGQPRLVCDGCGRWRSVTMRSGLPYKWLLDNRKAPGWTFVPGQKRRDYCRDCKPPVKPWK
jgi:hypothetical protein